MASSTTLKRRSQRAAEESSAFGPIAERFRRAGDLDRAVSLCREGLAKFPHHISARVTLGWSLLDLGKYDEARHELEQVLRRAPDNLAAIRGLAELHDRAEHTMNLPMDGPGQWPPELEDTGEFAKSEAIESLEVSAPIVDVEYEPEVQIATAAPETYATAAQFTAEPEFEVHSETDRVAVFTNSAGAAIAAEAAPAEAVAQAEASAVGEPEPFYADAQAATHAARAATVEVEATVEVDAVAASAEADLASEADIAALLAEAEKLEAAAAAIEAPVIEETAEFAGEPTGSIELEATDAEWATTAELMADVPVAAEAVAEELVAEAGEEFEVAAVAEPVEEFESAVFEETEPAAELTADAVAEPIAEVTADAEAVA